MFWSRDTLTIKLIGIKEEVEMTTSFVDDNFEVVAKSKLLRNIFTDNYYRFIAVRL